MKKIITYISLSAFAVSAFAQDTLKTDGIMVIKDFIPRLAEVIKIPSNPNPEVPEVKAPKLEYTLPETRFNTAPTIYTIKPLAMGTALLPKLKNNFFKLGYGNYNSPLLEAYISTVRNKTSQAGVYARHFSANPDGNRTFSDNSVKLWGKRFMDKGMVSTDVGYNRNVLHYYGYEELPAAVSKRDLRRQYSALDLHAGYSNIIKDTSKLKYNIDARFYNFIDNNSTVENDFKLVGDFGKRINGNPLDVNVMVNTNNTKTTLYNYGRLFIDVNPEYTLNMGQAYIKLGFNSTLVNDSAGNTFYFYPKAEVAYQVKPKTITAFAGITGKLNRTTYRGLAGENPFISTWGLANTSNKFELYAGFKGEISAQTSFLLQFSSANVQNMVFYGFDSLNRGQVVIFDTTSIRLTNVKAELNHEFGEKFHFQFVMNYFGYSNLQIAQPFSRPTFTTRTNLMYNIGDKFIIRGDLYTMNSRKSIELPNNQQVTLGTIVDLNMGIDYRYTKNLGLFLNVNNITNNQYQRWYNYQVYGLNVLGGLSVTF
ncbi:MAG: hypothetical protein V4658_04305 [Bacteroidota bacterium]